MIKDRDITFQVINGVPQVPASRPAAPRLIAQWHNDADGRLTMRWGVELEVHEHCLLQALAA
jgi:hypothetical protein